MYYKAKLSKSHNLPTFSYLPLHTPYLSYLSASPSLGFSLVPSSFSPPSFVHGLSLDLASSFTLEGLEESESLVFDSESQIYGHVVSKEIKGVWSSIVQKVTCNTWGVYKMMLNGE